ncbi:MAG: AAA family ATPase [Anaerolineae bacterium]
MYIQRVKLFSDHYPTNRYYPFNVPILRTTSQLTFRKPVTFFVGENGSGKSTLLEAITKKCGIHVWEKTRRHRAHENPYETKLADFIQVVWCDDDRVSGSLFRAETFQELADFLDDVAVCDPGRLRYHGGHLLNTLSHGQSMLTYFSGRYDRKGLYFLDEPEAALSPTSQMKFLRLLQSFSERGKAQFIIATHSPILLALPNAQIYSFDGPRIQEVSYEDTEHYKVYKQFFTDRGSVLGKEPVEKARVLASEQPPAEAHSVTVEASRS